MTEVFARNICWHVFVVLQYQYDTNTIVPWPRRYWYRENEVPRGTAQHYPVKNHSMPPISVPTESRMRLRPICE